MKEKLEKHRLYYLASPYTHHDEAVKNNRFWKTIHTTAHLQREGYKVFSPIVHSHYISKWFQQDSSFEFYEEFDLDMLARCDGIIVLKLDGWKESKGVQTELTWSRKYTKQIIFMDWIEEEDCLWLPEFDDDLDILLVGAKKYGFNNWLSETGKKSSHTDMHNSLFHHAAESYANPGKVDPESKKDPILHAIVRAKMIYARRKRGIIHVDDSKKLR